MDLGGTATLLRAAAKLVQPIPAAGGMLAGLLDAAADICEAAKVAEANRATYRQLAEEIAGYASAVAQAVQDNPHFSLASTNDVDPIREKWIKAISELSNVLQDTLHMIQDKQIEYEDRRTSKNKTITKLRHTWHAIRYKGSSSDSIDEIRNKLRVSLQTFQINTSIQSYGTSKRLQDTIEALTQGHATLQNTTELIFLEQKLAPVKSARFDGEEAFDRCLPNTRVQVLGSLRVWATTRTTSSSSVVFCLSGMAGTGKTTITREICIMFDRISLGASFFISRSSASRRSAERIIQTIVYQLALQQAGVSSTITKTLQNGRDVTTRPLAEQVEDLLSSSLKVWKDTNPPLLLVIDALDECDKVAGREGGDLLPLLVSTVRQLSGRVRLLITSREEPAIMRTLEALGMNSNLGSIRLHKIDETVVKTDIELFYTHHFARIAARAGISHSSPWPSKSDFDLLVKRTGKLFVFAALVIRLVGDERVDPEDQLYEILHSPASSATNDAYHDLDELYLPVLIKASTSENKAITNELVKRIRNLISTLVLLQSPLSSEAISKLLNAKLSLIKQDVSQLSAVLLIQIEAPELVTIFHPSFAEFLLTRCPDERFKIDPQAHHAYLAYRCITIMNAHLKRNICNIEGPFVMNEDLKDLSERRGQYLPSELCYACEHWAAHLSRAYSPEEGLMKELQTFCEQHLLHWVEVLSLLGCVHAGQRNLPGAIRWCKDNVSSHDKGITTLLNDIQQTIHDYDLAIIAGPLQVYCTALIFMPKCKLYDQTHNDKMAIHDLKLVSNQANTWPASHRSIKGHGRDVNSVAFSPDGSRIVSGSDDNTVRVWDSATSAILATLEGHADKVLSVAFSPDGMYVVSGSSDRTIRVWNSTTGITHALLEGHTDWVCSVAFSPNGIQIASGSYDTTIRVWSLTTSTALAIFQGHTSYVYSVGFSPDGTKIASGSHDNSVRIWNSTSGAILAVIKIYTGPIHSVAFSPDGEYIAAGSVDMTVNIWNLTTNDNFATLKGHSHVVSSVVYSPDGTKIVSGSYDQTVRVWDLTTGDIVAILKGHTSDIQSIAFSPDGLYIASGSNDKTIRIWDSTISVINATPEGHVAYVMSVTFSPDEKRIASNSQDNTICIWDSESGAILVRLRGHTDWVLTSAFSPDGTHIVSGSRDNLVLVWDLATGVTLTTLQGHTGYVQSVAYSPDGMSIISGSSDCTIRVWNSVTGAILATLEGHSHWVSSVAYSPDGTKIASGSYDRTVRVWDSTTYAVVAILKGHTNYVQSIAFSPDVTRIASGSDDKTVRIWDPVTGVMLALLKGHTNSITSVAFSPEGTGIASGSGDQTVRIWNSVTGASLQTFHGITNAISVWPKGKVQQNSSLLRHEVNSIITFDSKSGWLYLQSGQTEKSRALCWIPGDRQPYNASSVLVSNQYVFISTLLGGVTILSYSNS